MLAEEDKNAEEKSPLDGAWYKRKCNNPGLERTCFLFESDHSACPSCEFALADVIPHFNYSAFGCLPFLNIVNSQINDIFSMASSVIVFLKLL